MRGILLIDADSLCYSACLCSRTEDDEGFVRDMDVATKKFDELLVDIVTSVNAYKPIESYCLFIGGVNNYRKLLFPSYKASRRLKTLPTLLPSIKQYAVDKHSAFACHGCEADDTVYSTYLHHVANGDDVVLATIDKDLRQIGCPMYNYHPSHRCIEEYTPEAAMYAKYYQLLVGDSSDDINYTKGIGVKKAEKILAGATTPFGYLRRIYAVYKQMHKGKARERFMYNALLVGLNKRTAIPEEWCNYVMV